MRAVKAELAPPLLGQGEKVLNEKGSFDIRAGPTRVPFQERKASELGGIISMDGGRPTQERIKEKGRAEITINVPGGIAQFGKVEYPRLFPLLVKSHDSIASYSSAMQDPSRGESRASPAPWDRNWDRLAVQPTHATLALIQSARS